MSDFEKLKEDLKNKLSKVQSSKEADTIKLEIFGKNGLINSKVSLKSLDQLKKFI